MPKKSSGSKSKRVTSKTRHKIDRKKRENKRDLKKAAKAMRKSGIRVRPKKNRERSKLALRLSSKDPNKEKALNALLRSRERVRVSRQERREQRAALKAREAEAAARGETLGSSGDDADELVGGRNNNGADDDEAGTRDAAWMHPVSANMLEKQQRQQRRVEHEAQVAADRSRGVRRFMAFPPGTPGSGDPAFQLRKIISGMRELVPGFLITLDARCVLESVPWSVLDDIVADAVAVYAQLPEKQEHKVRHVVFAVTRADLVTTDSLVRGTVALAAMLKERYHNNEPTVAACVSFTAAACSATASSSSAAYLLKVMQQKCADIAGQRRATAAATATAASAAAASADGSSSIATSTPAAGAMSKKDMAKVAFCVYGFPNTGRTALCAALIKKATTSTCAIVQTGGIVEIVEGPENTRRFRFEEARPLTLLNVSDSHALSKVPIVGGDVLFHRHGTADNMQNPELPATKLLESLSADNFAAVCRAFGQGACENPRHFLFALGRGVRRDSGFYTPHGDDAVVAQIADGLFASSIDGVAQPTVRAFHSFAAQKRDSGDAVRIGARVFLHEFCRGDAGLRWSTNAIPESLSAANAADSAPAAKKGSKKGAAAPAAASSSTTDDAASFVGCLGAVFDAPPPPNRRARDELTGQEGDENSATNRGLAVVVGLQHVAESMPVVGISTASGLRLGGESVAPLSELQMADDDAVERQERMLLAQQESSDDDDDDDFLDEFGGDLMDMDDEELPEDFEDFDDEEDEELDPALQRSRAFAFADDSDDVPPVEDEQPSGVAGRAGEDDEEEDEEDLGDFDFDEFDEESDFSEE